MHPSLGDVAYGVFVESQMQSLMRAGVHADWEFVDGHRGPFEYLRAAYRLRHRLKHGAWDVVHAHYGLTGFTALFQPRPLVVSFCGDDLLGTPDGRGGITLKSRIQRELSYVAARRADAIICKSAELREALPNADDRRRAFVVPNGLDVQVFHPGDRQQARATLELSGDENTILFPHTPSVPRKRLDLAQAAVNGLAERVTRANLLIVQGVTQPVLADYYRAADCMLLTSDQEGSPNTIKEALCSDLPVVSVDVGDVRD